MLDTNLWLTDIREHLFKKDITNFSNERWQLGVVGQTSGVCNVVTAT